MDFGFWISDFGFWILDFGFRILDFGFWILGHYVAIFFGADFGFWIFDFDTRFGPYIRLEYWSRRPGSADSGQSLKSFCLKSASISGKRMQVPFNGADAPRSNWNQGMGPDWQCFQPDLIRRTRKLVLQ